MMYEETRSILRRPFELLLTVIWVLAVLAFIPAAVVWMLWDESAKRVRSLRSS